MLDHSLTFDRPQYLLLLLLVPLFWMFSYRSLAALGPWRRAFALTLRTVVAAAIILALADVQYQRRSDGLTVVYLLDQSLSIPAENRQAMFDYVAAAIDQHAQTDHDDRFAVIAFGRDAAVEIPPVDADVPPPRRLESQINPELTDLAGAVRQAQALFPADAARRIVLVTDGNENVGNLYRDARAAADAGVSLDVVPVYLNRRDEVAVEKIDLPPNVRRGQPFNLRVVLNREVSAEQAGAAASLNEAGSPNQPDAAPIPGTLQVTRKIGDQEETVASEKIALAPGKQVFTIRQLLDRPDFYSYEARFVPDDPAADAAAQNNTAAGFTQIHGHGRVLFIENYEAPGQFNHLVDRLRANDIEVAVAATDRLFNSLLELQRYDAVVLANVPRSSADDSGAGASFTDEQIDMLVQNTRQLGCGLIMLGGPDALGAGGWANTRLEEAMPVEFQIKAAEVVPVGALSLVIDRSGSMAGEKLEMSKAAAIEAVKAIGRRDYISVVAFDAAPTRIVPLQRVGNYSSAARRIDTLGAGGGTDAFPAMQAGFADLRNADAAVKHMIVLTDGQTPEARFPQLVADMRRAGVTVSTVAVGADANVPLLQQIAAQGRGKFYLVRNPRGLPRIFLREVRRVSRPLVYEPPSPVTPQIIADHEILRGVEAGVPPITGLVLTTVKDNPLVEVVLRSPLPVTEKNATLLATWTYGAGRTAVFTTDAGRRWAGAWPEWDGYDKFFTQLVRWAMRPTGDTGDYTIATNTRDGQTELVVTAAGDNSDALGDVEPIVALAISPDLKQLPVVMRQTAPGRYIGSFPSTEPGSYLIVVNTGGGRPPIRTGVNVGYSPEYRDRETNLALLSSVAHLTAHGGRPGELYRQGLDPQAIREEGSPNPFRRDLPRPSSTQPIWPWTIVCGACLFWCDVFVRRVQVNFAWLHAAVDRARAYLIGATLVPAAAPTMERLKTRKRTIAEQVTRRAPARGYVSEESDVSDESQPVRLASSSAMDVKAETEAQAMPSSAPTESSVPLATESPSNDPDNLSPAERLLRAKRDAWKK